MTLKIENLFCGKFIDPVTTTTTTRPIYPTLYRNNPYRPYDDGQRQG